MAACLFFAFSPPATAQPQKHLLPAALRVPRELPLAPALDVQDRKPIALAWDRVQGKNWILGRHQLCLVTGMGQAMRCADLGLARDQLRAQLLTFEADTRHAWILLDRDDVLPGAGAEGPAPRACRFKILHVGDISRVELDRCIDLPRRPGNARVTGFAWDGEALWVASGGGLCACMSRIDPSNGGTLLRFFPRCEPRGIAVDPDGTNVWIVADSGMGRALLLQRPVRDRAGNRKVELAFRTVLVRALPMDVEPVALSVSDDEVFVLARDATIHKSARPDLRLKE